MSAAVDELKRQGKKIGFVPTMGALHAGHLSLIATARQQSDVVVASIFVNPTQFNDPADLERYPRPVEADIAKLESASCDILFLPAVDEMYAPGESWHIELGTLERLLEGSSRPGHYQGVTQVVFKLFDLVKPDLAFFGQKDFQQVMILIKMVEQLRIPVQIVMCPIVREDDGLALSSRNIHLSGQERKQALALHSILQQTKARFAELSVEELELQGREALRLAPGVALDYFVVCKQSDLSTAQSKEEPLVALVAASVGTTRLIDNMILN